MKTRARVPGRRVVVGNQRKAKRKSGRHRSAEHGTVAPSGSWRHRWTWLALAIILLLGAGVRGAYLAELVHTPDFDHPGRDALYHDYWARALVSGDWTPPPGKADPEIRTNPYLRAPGYPYFLAVVYRLTGSSYLAARVVQMLLGLASAFLAFLLARRMFDAVAGLLAAAFLALYWIFPYYEGELHAPVLAVFLILALGNLLDLWARRDGITRALGSGLLLGTLMLVRPNALLLVPVALGWIAWVAHRGGRRPVRPLLALLFGTVAVVAPATLRNLAVSGEPVLVSSSAGINLYLTHNPQADGVTSYIPELTRMTGRAGWTCFDYPAIVQGVQRITGEPVGPSGASSFFAHRALAFIRDHPIETAGWALRRAALFWGPAEVSNDEVVAYDRAFSPILAHLPGGFPLVLTLALLGAALLVAEARAAREDKRGDPAREVAVLLGLLVLAYFLSILPTVAAARYRVPVIPLLLVFGACGVARLAEWLHRREPGLAAGWVLAAAAVYLVVSRPYVPYHADAGFWHANQAAAYQRQGDLEAAAREYRAALEADPGNADARTNLGAVFAALGRLDEAAAEQREALRLRPRFAEGHNNLGGLLYQEGKLPEAEAEYRAALEIDPDFAQAHHNLGLVLAAQGSLDEAEAEYRRALDLAPGYAHAHAHLGDVLAARGEWEEAVAEARRALELAPESAEAERSLGAALLAGGDLAGAEEHYRAALRAAPGDGLAAAGLGRALVRDGRFQEAISQLRTALESRPEDVALRNDLGTALARSGDLEGAIAELRKALEIDPQAYRAENDLGTALARHGQVEEAFEHFSRAAELAPDYPDARLNLAHVLLTRGRFEEAFDQYREALRLRPGWPRAADELAALLLARRDRSPGHLHEARELARQACEGTGYRESRYMATLAAVLAASGRPEEAAETASRAAGVARSAGQEDLAAELERRAQRYRKGAGG